METTLGESGEGENKKIPPPSWTVDGKA